MGSFEQKYSLEADHIFEGKYKIIRELGVGGFGMVYLAHQIAMDRPVALKILKPGVGAHAPSARERFLREVKIISKLRHPNTVTIHDYGETVHGIVYMVLEFVEGRTLKELLRQEGAQEPMRALGIARQIVRSLGEAHNHQVVHRDLKPANIMLTELEADTDFVKVLDFGVARLLDTPEVDLTSAGVPEGERALIGTPRYMSPEQVRGEHLNGASDLYSLGLMLYEMLVGEPAVQGDTTMGLISQQLSPEPLRLRSIQGLPECLKHLILRATAKNIGQRFRSADEFARAIDQTAIELAEGLGHRGRAATGAYFASSGRFPVVSRPIQAPHHVHPGAPPAQNQYGDPSRRELTSAGTPSSIRQHSTESGQISYSSEQWIAGSPQPSNLDYYEERFDPDEIARRSVAPVQAPHGSLQPFQNPRQHRGQQIGVNHGLGQQGPGQMGRPQTQPPRQQQPSQGMNPSFEFVGNQIEMEPSEELFGIPSSALPLPPDVVGSPFDQKEERDYQLDEEIQKPKKKKKARPVASAQSGSEESLVGFGFTVIKLCFLGLLAGFFVYMCFLISGALIGQFVQGAMQIAVASTLAIAIPLFTALGENSQKERFEVVHKASHRLSRVFIGSAIFSAATAFIISFAMPWMVTDQLRNDPNWMFKPSRGVVYEPTSFTEFNKDVSFMLADGVEVVTVFLGRYDGTPTQAQSSSTVRDTPRAPSGTVVPPAPTRPSTRGAPAGASQGTNGDEAEQQENRERRGPPSSNDDESGDYVRW